MAPDSKIEIGLPPGPVIDDRRHAVVGRDRQEVRLELFALGDVHRDHGVWEAALLEHDRDLPAVGRRPEIEIDRRIVARGPCFRFSGRRGLAAGAGVLPDRFVGNTGHWRLPEGRDKGPLRLLLKQAATCAPDAGGITTGAALPGRGDPVSPGAAYSQKYRGRRREAGFRSAGRLPCRGEVRKSRSLFFTFTRSARTGEARTLVSPTPSVVDRGRRCRSTIAMRSPLFDSRRPV